MFEILKARYERNFVRKDQLQKYVKLGKITQEEYNKIIKGEIDLTKEVIV